jgi:predicted permease
VSNFLQNRTADIRYALRMMRKSPGFSSIAILSLALGIGANTAIFTLVDAILLKMLPVKDPRQLYMVGIPNPRGGVGVIWNYPDYAAFRDHNRGFSGLIAYTSSAPYGFTLQAPANQQTELAYGALVSGNYFEVLGVDPAAGRVLNPEDDRKPGAGPHIVLSHDFWLRRFRSDPRVIGVTVRINGYPFTIVGVSRSGFTGAEIGSAPDFFMPIMMRTEVTGNPNWNNRNNWWLSVMGRLKTGASIPQLESELYVISKQQEALDRRTALEQRFVNEARPIKLITGAQGYSFLRNRLSQPLLVLMTMVGLVLLIACANVANLLLARAAARRHEIAVRLAVGASRRRLAGQLLTESLLLGTLGGAVGLVFAYFGVRVLVQLIPQGGWNLIALDVTPDLRLLGFTIAVSLLTGFIFGLAPAIQSTRPAVVPALREETGSTEARGRFHLRKGLVVLQVALSLLLLIGASLFVRSLRNLRALEAGFYKDHLLFVTIDPSRNGYKGQRLRDYYERLGERAAALPGVRVATLANITPLAGSRWNDEVSFSHYQWKPQDRRYVDMNAVSPRFFEAMGIPVVLGRDFRPEDNPAYTPDPPALRRPGTRDPHETVGPRLAIINESVARKYFSDRSPIGERFSLSQNYRPDISFEIVGVVKDARYFGLRESAEPMIYVPVWRPGAGMRTLVVRTSGEPERMIEAIRREAHVIDNTVPVLRTRTMEQHIDNNVLQEKVIATLSTFFGLLALLLASLGLYGVMAHAVTRRTREIGIRMALGAARHSVLWLVLSDALVLVIAGAAVGIPTALAVSRFAATFLYGITPRDPVSAALATIVLLGVAAFASYLPARRATRVDPNVALRYE